MFGASVGIIAGGIGQMIQKIRERRARLGKRPIFGRYNVNDRSDRLKLQARIETQNQMVKYDNGQVTVAPASKPVGMVQPMISGVAETGKRLTGWLQANLWVLALIPVAWLLVKEDKPARRTYRRKKKSKPVRKAATKTKTVRTGKPAMPVKYRKGCKGKKGTELGRCLQYWRKYRKGEIRLS